MKKHSIKLCLASLVMALMLSGCGGIEIDLSRLNKKDDKQKNVELNKGGQVGRDDTEEKELTLADCIPLENLLALNNCILWDGI